MLEIKLILNLKMLFWVRRKNNMDVWDFLRRFAWIVLIGTLSSFAIAAVATIGGLYHLWPLIPMGATY